MGSLAFVILGACQPSSAQPLVFDEKIGHYKDLSYEVLSDEGLSWEEQVKLFGGETVHYEELTNQERGAKEAELTELLRRMRIAYRMVHPNFSDMERAGKPARAWLDWAGAAGPDQHALFIHPGGIPALFAYGEMVVGEA